MRENTTSESTAVDSNDHYNSVLRTIVLPMLGSVALTAITLAILYAFFKHFRQKRKGNTTETNLQALTLNVHTNDFTVSMRCWTRWSNMSFCSLTVSMAAHFPLDSS